MLEFLLLSIVYFTIIHLLDSSFLPREKLMLMNSFNYTIMPYVGLFAAVILTSYIYGVFYSKINCKDKKWRSDANFKMGLLTAVCSVAAMAVFRQYPIMTQIFRNISIMPRVTNLGIKFGVALSTVIAYKLSALVFSHC